MNKQQITELFNQVLNQRGKLAKVPGVTKDMIYAWRRGITTPPIGDMLGVLFELNLIAVDEPTSK